MKFRRFSVIIAGLMLVMCGLRVFAAQRIVVNGGSDRHITISQRCSIGVRHAAKELQHFLKEISGAELLIVHYDTVGAHPLLERGRLRRDFPEIMVGKNRRVEQLFKNEKIDFDWDKLGDEGFLIKTVGPHLVIAGNSVRGTLYGVYGFLEDHLGCRWLDSMVSVIPDKKTIVVGNIQDVQVPSFEFRDITFGMYKYDSDLAVRNKINGLVSPLTDIHGGRFAYAPYKYHTFARLLPPSKYFKEHPEYFSEINGKRVPRQPCLTNPEVVEIMTENVLQWMRERPGYKYFEMSQNDGGGYCQCEKCAALDEKEGGQQGTIMTFMNKVGERVAKEFPDKYIITYAYHYSDKPPKTIRPRDNVGVFFCSFCSSHLHSYEKHGFSCRYKAGVPGGLGEAMKMWSEMTDKVFVWEYSGDQRNLLRPFPNYRIVKTNMKFMSDIGIDGVFSQNTGHGRCGGLVPLQSWLWAKVAWDVDFDVGRGINDFVEGYYGPAAKPMREFVELLVDNVPEWGNKEQARKRNGYPWWMRPELIEKYDKLFDEAEQLAASDKNVLSRIRTTRLGVLYEKIRQMEASEPERVKLAEEFLEGCERAGISEVVYYLRTAEGRIKHCTPTDYYEHIKAESKKK